VGPSGKAVPNPSLLPDGNVNAKLAVPSAVGSSIGLLYVALQHDIQGSTLFINGF